MQKQPLLGRTLHELQDVVKSLGMPGFAAKQIAMWLYDKKVAAIDEMTNLSLKHRELLKEAYEVGACPPVEAMHSVDGTVKYLYRVGENHFVESVYIPEEDRSGVQDELQVLHDGQARLYRQPDRRTNHQPDKLVTRTGQADQRGDDGHG